MDRQPPPQEIFRHHQNHIRYENVLRPPDFVPPPPYPQLVIDRSHRHEFDPPPKPYFLPTPLPPPREMIPLPIVHDYPERNLLAEDNIFHWCRTDNIRELHENWDRNSRLVATVVHNRVPDIDVGGRDRYRDVITESFELHRKRDNGRSWDIGISSDLDRRRDYDERRWNSVMDDRSLDLYRERDYDGRRCNSGMNERSRDLYWEHDCDERRWEIGMSERSRELYREHAYDERRWYIGMSEISRELYRKGNFEERRCDSGINNQVRELYHQVEDDGRRWGSNWSTGVLSRLGNRQPDFDENVPSSGGALSRLGHRQPVFDGDVPSPGGVLSRLGNRQLGRFSGRLGTGDCNSEFNRPDKKKKLQKKNTLHRIQSGKFRGRHNGGFKFQHFAKDSNRGNFKGNEKGSGKMQTRLEGKRDWEQGPVELSISFMSNALVARAIEVPSDPAVELCGKSKSAKERLGFNVSSSKNDTVSDLQTDSRRTSTGHQYEDDVFGNGSVTANNARDLSENIPNNAHMEVMNPKGFTVVRSGKRKRATEQSFLEDRLDNSVGTCKSFVPELKKEKSRLDSSDVSDNVITKFTNCAEGLITTTEDADEDACHAHQNFISTGRTGYEDSLGSNQHVNSVNKYIHNGVHDVSELSVSGEAALLERSFAEETSEDIVRIEDHDTGCLSRYQETRVPEVENYFSEIHDLISSPKSDYAVMQATEDAIISDVDPKDANSEDVLPSQASEPQIMLDANHFRSLEGHAVTDCSDVAFDVSISSSFLSANDKETLPEFDESFPKIEETGLYVENSSPKVISDRGDCFAIDTSSYVVRKRKGRGDQLPLSGRKADADVGTVGSINGEVMRHSAKDISPAMGGVSEKDSSREDVSLKEGPSGREDSVQEFGSFPACQKKQKFSSPRSSLSSLSDDGTIVDGLILHSSIPSEFGDEQSDDASSPSTTTSLCGTTYVEGEVGVDSYVVNLVDGNQSHEGDLALITSGVSCSDRNSLSASNSGDELLTSGFDMQSCITSPEELQVYTDLSFSGKTKLSFCRNDDLSYKNKSVIADPNANCTGKYLEAALDKSQTSADIPLTLHKDTSLVVKKLYPVHGRTDNQRASAVPKVFPAQHPLSFCNTRKLFSHVTKSRTWCRSGNSTVPVTEPKLQHSPAQINGTNAATSIQSSYIRKGNSLVRKPSPSHDTSPGFHGSSSSVYRLSPCTNTMKNNMATQNKTGDAVATTLKRTGKISTSEMTKSPSTNHSGNSLNCTPCNLEEPLSIRNPYDNVCSSKALDVEERIKSSPVHEYQTDSVVNSDSQSTVGEGNSEKKIVYVKRRSYQLVATSNSNDASVSKVDNSQSQLSDGYYKRRGHQLVRASPENRATIGNENANVPRMVLESVISKTSSRRQSGFSKTRRYSKFSFVWKLHDTQSSEKLKHSLGPRKVLPYLFSHKRAAYWRSLKLGIKPPISNISQKLLVSRKRGAIYTRSSHGYSLKMSKVLSVGGSSLKWSKSIERDSKKANEDATRAVAAAGKRKKEEKGAVPIASKTRNHVSRKWVLDVKLRPGTPLCNPGDRAAS